MGFGRRHYGAGSIEPWAENSTRRKKFVCDYFGSQPICFENDMTAANGATGATNLMHTGKYVYEYFLLGAGQTILVPTWTASGLLWSLDLVDNEGCIISPGITANSLGSFTIGTDRSFYAETTLTLADVSGVDDLFFGFTKNQAYATAVTTFTDYFGVGLNTAANPGAIKVRWNLNDGTDASVDTTQTWADGASKTIKVVVGDDGFARAYINGQPPTISKTNFQFDSGDSVNWMLFGIHATTTPGAWHTDHFEWGYTQRKGE